MSQLSIDQCLSGEATSVEGNICTGIYNVDLPCYF